VELDAYLEQLASDAPTPGGGSAATIVAGAGAALVAMVARITRKNPAFAANDAEAATIVERADTLRCELLAARVEDEAAYARVVDAQALPRTTPEDKAARTVALQAALAGAAEAPLRAAELALAVVRLSRDVGALGNAHLVSDVTCAAAFGRAALEASAANVRINHAYMRDASLVASQEALLRAFEAEAIEN
jgi:formiminotetrahydrofolate cyclodeaminase